MLHMYIKNIIGNYLKYLLKICFNQLTNSFIIRNQNYLSISFKLNFKIKLIYSILKYNYTMNKIKIN